MLDSMERLHGNSALCTLSGMFSLQVSVSSSPPSPTLISLGSLEAFKSKKTVVTTSGGELRVPTFSPSQDANGQRPIKQRLAAIIGAGVGATLLVATVVIIVYFCLMRLRRLARRSEMESSESSAHVDMVRGHGSPHAGIHSPYEAQYLSQLTLPELGIATSNFSPSNFIGEGGFGLVYKGLLQDGSIVAIKQRFHDPSQYFVQEVQNMSQIRHRHLVKLIGYCQESEQQLLVFEYMSNGNVGNHLYDTEGLPTGKLDIRQRISIALGAARGLEYLHALVPPCAHMHFKTSNVLLDEHYNAKVADYGLSKFLVGGYRAGPSSTVDCFHDPELSMSNGFLERSDIYSFGVFLLVLISGHDALDRNRSEHSQTLVERAKSTTALDSFIDKTLGNGAMEAILRVMELALQCLEAGVRRPTMKQIVGELELIHERGMHHQKTKSLDEIGAVTLGSELFK